jgi:hypothetical protein
MFLRVDGGRPQISSSGTSHGGRRRRFLVLTVGAPNLRHCLPEGSSSTFLSFDGGHSRISISTRQGAHHRRFLALMVGTPGSPALKPPRGPVVDVSLR